MDQANENNNAQRDSQMAQTSMSFRMTAADRNSMYEQMYNNYNLFKYGKVLCGKQRKAEVKSIQPTKKKPTER